VEDLPVYPLAGLWYIFGQSPVSETPPKLFPWIFNQFMPLDKDSKDGPKKFQDTWYNTLPMDNGISDTVLPIQFSELWFPVEKTKEMINMYKDHCKRYGYLATSYTFTEVYPAKKQTFG